MSRTRTLLLPLALSAGLLATAVPVAAPASAAPRSTTYAIPGGKVYPEGVATSGDAFWVTSTSDGTIYRGATGQRALSVWSPGGADGRTTAIGLEASPKGGRLVVAGGGTGTVFVYDTATGRLVARYTNGSSSTFLNDVTFSPAGDAYVTDSVQPVVYRIPAADLARGTGAVRDLQVFRQLGGTAFAYQDGFNANGLAVTPDGSALLVVQSNTGKLFRITLGTREVSEVDLHGARLTNGDGVERRGAVLYVNRNANGVLSKVKVAPDGREGRVYGQVSDPSFRYPTTSAFSRSTLLVVNSQFDVRSTGGTPRPFTVTGITAP